MVCNATVALFYNPRRAMPQTCRKNGAIFGQVVRIECKELLMANRGMKLSSRKIRLVAALALAGVSLAGCVYYPSGYGYGYAPGYYSPGYVAAPPVVIGGGWGWWGGGRGRWR
jgi:hypothetical protein